MNAFNIHYMLIEIFRDHYGITEKGTFKFNLGPQEKVMPELQS